MKCPIDGSDLVMTERQGIEIDYCPQCRGVWLDRGELDKIIERATPQQPASFVPAQQPASFTSPQPSPAAPPHYQQPDYPRAHYDPRHQSHQPHHKKRKSFLGEIFDFG